MEIFGRRAAESTRKGQCQRYQEYESLPSTCSGAESSTTPIPRLGCSAPAIKAAAVPTTGTTAIQPGKFASPEMKCAEPRIERMPSQPKATHQPKDHLRAPRGSRTASPPMPNSQALAGN